MDQEGKDSIIELKAVESYGDEEDLSCDDPEAIGLMLDYMYCGDYNLRSGEPVDTRSPDALIRPQIFWNSEPADSELVDLIDYDWDKPTKARGKRSSKKKHGIYFGSAPDPEDEIGPSDGIEQPRGSLTMHSRLYALGCKYNLKHLSDVAEAKMQEAVRGVWERQDFAKAISTALGSTTGSDVGMRTTIINTILSCSANLVNDDLIKKAIEGIDGLAFELFRLQSTSSKRKVY